VKTPLRVGCLGGSSDISSYFSNHPPGCCINATINKSVYVLVRKRFDDYIYLKYSKNEICHIDDIDSLQHDFIRETLKYLEIDYGLEIINFADISTSGTGLGSSSSFLVGLLHALYTLEGEAVSKEKLAQDACHIEIDLCKKDIGYQDQYAAVYGGINCLTFDYIDNKEVVTVINLVKDYAKMYNLSKYFMLFHTGIGRSSSDILSDQNKNVKNDDQVVQNMKENVSLALNSIDLFSQNEKIIAEELGKGIKRNWELKKTFSNKISSKNIDNLCDQILDAKAYGVKITGAGGGGFLLVVSDQIYQEKIRMVMMQNGLKEMPFLFEPYGSRVVLNVEEYRW